MSAFNKRLVRRFYEEVENQLKLELVDEIVAPDFRDTINSGSPVPLVGTEGVKNLAKRLHDGLDMHIEIADLVAEGDRVVARIAGQLTHKLPLAGVAPTGKRISYNGVEIWRVADGKLAERWVFIDMVAIAKELGAAPP